MNGSKVFCWAYVLPFRFTYLFPCVAHQKRSLLFFNKFNGFKIGYMDVFKRVADFIRKNGYTISTPKDEQSPIVMKVGTNLLRWNNVKDFVSAGWHSHGCWDREGYISIFRVISYWTSKYYKLAYPSLRKLVDKVKVLGEVSESAIMPFAVMKELNRLKI